MYKYTGKEKVSTDCSQYVVIYWNDGTFTRSVVKEDDRFDFKLGLLLTASKKFVKYLNINKLEEKLDNTEALKTVLSLLLVNTVGEQFITDMDELINQFKSRENDKCRQVLTQLFS